METKFQSSFIPQKPASQEKVHSHSGVSLFMIIATIIFVLSLAGAGLTYVAKGVLLKKQGELKVTLANNQKRFDVPLIEDLKKADAKLALAKQILSNHVAASEAFNIISKLTIDGVRFSSFVFSGGTAEVAQAAPVTNGTPASAKPAGSIYRIVMKGMANNFLSVAFQSDVFGMSGKYGTNKAINNPTISDLIVDDKGNVNFSFSANLTQPEVSYEKVLSQKLGQ